MPGGLYSPAMIRSALALGLAAALAAAPALFPGAASADALPGPVAQALARAGVPQSAVGLYVQPVDAPRPTAIFNASKPMNPASAIKLVTTFAALDLLGPAYTWKTEAYLLARLQGDVLDGDLLLKGYGDPKLTMENFWLFLRGLRARGLREIRGDLVLDRSFFDVGEHDPAKFDGEGLRPYNVGADALLVNYKAVRFFFLPGETAQGVSVVPEPKLAQLEVASSVALRDGACGDWRAGLKYELQQNGAGARASFSGSMPASCGERVWNLAPLGPNEYVLGVFKSLWQELGGTLAGGVREASAPAGAKPFAVFESPAAAEVLRDMNKFSNNVMARQVFLTLSAETLRLPGALRALGAGGEVLARGAQARRAGARDRERLRPLARRPHQPRGHGTHARRRVSQRGDAGVHRHDAARRLRRHDAQAAEARGASPGRRT